MKRALAVLLLLTACGGGSEGGSAKDDYLAKAEVVCAKANADLAEANKAKPPQTPIPEYVQRIVDIARTTVTELAAIEAPPEDRADIDAKVLTPLREQVTTAEAYQAQVGAALAAKDNTALLQLLTKPPTETKADLAFMKDYGFDDCTEAADTANAAK